MDAIGGYFGLEITVNKPYHSGALKLNTGRNCLEYILRVRNYTKVYLPYYTCDVLLETLQRLCVEYEFYRINESLEPLHTYQLKTNEAFLYTNYYGLKQKCVEWLALKYGNQLIIDNAQAFYCLPIEGIDTFYSVRKFFGSADGAYLYTNKVLNDYLPEDHSTERMSHLLKRIDYSAEYGYSDFVENDNLLKNAVLSKMSKMTENILCGVNYERVREIRLKNYLYIDKALKHSNLISLPLNGEAVPMVYPYYTNNKTLRKKLINHKIFVATYWPNVLDSLYANDLEYQLAESLIPIPIDQRYNYNHMDKIIKLINE